MKSPSPSPVQTIHRWIWGECQRLTLCLHRPSRWTNLASWAGCKTWSIWRLEESGRHEWNGAEYEISTTWQLLSRSYRSFHCFSASLSFLHHCRSIKRFFVESLSPFLCCEGGSFGARRPWTCPSRTPWFPMNGRKWYRGISLEIRHMARGRSEGICGSGHSRWIILTLGRVGHVEPKNQSSKSRLGTVVYVVRFKFESKEIRPRHAPIERFLNSKLERF